MNVVLLNLTSPNFLMDTEEGPGYQTLNEEEPVIETHEEMEDLRREAQNAKEFNINKPKPFDGNQKDIQSFILDCRVYLQLEVNRNIYLQLEVNRNIYHNDDSKVAFILSFMNEKEAMRWKENYLLEIMNATGDLAFPAYADFMERLSKDLVC
jgi:hypothetical protein